MKRAWPPHSSWVTAAAVVAVAITSVIGGVAALLATAIVTATPAVFLTVGALVFLGLDYAGVRLVASRRWAPPRRRGRRRAVFVSSTGLLLAAFALTCLVPTHPPPEPSVPGEQSVRVSTGSRLAVVHLEATRSSRHPPIVVLHGGPGVPDLRDNIRSFGALTGHGFDVYLYSQLGSGESTRSDDPTRYGRDRDVADLEALRRRLGLHRMVLVGHSYGGELAAAYLARHPAHVAAMVLLSPGPLDPSDHSPDRATAGLSFGARLRLYRTLAAPRALLGYALLQVNPRAAHAYYPDDVADARNDLVIERSRPALHCPGHVPAEEPVAGTGFYAMQYPQSMTASPPSDPRQDLTGLTTPTLIVKGSCDYLSWRSAIDYLHRLPNARLVYLRGAGHNIQQDKPVLTRDLIVDLVEHRPLVVPPYRGAGPPADYQGPS